MQPIATDDSVAWCVSLSVCPSVCHAPVPCNTAKRIKALFGMETLGAQRTIIRRDPFSYGERVKELSLIVPSINTPVPIHYPYDATFDVVIAKLL